MYHSEFRIGPILTPWVKRLMIVHLVVFLLVLLGNRVGYPISYWLSLSLNGTMRHFMVWQLFTFLFVHVRLFPFLFNMLILWMFGCDVESALGGRRFLGLYAWCGIGAGVTSMIISAFGSGMMVYGPAGSLFGILMAFALLFPDKVITLLVFFVLPVSLKAKYLVAIFALIEVLLLLGGGGGLVPLTGMAFGYVFVHKLSFFDPMVAGIASLARAMNPWSQAPVPKIRFVLGKKKKRDSGHYISSEVDPILDKISAQGFQSLTRREKKILDKAKKLMKDKDLEP